MRTKGSKNKSKFICVKVEDLSKIFNPNVEIRIDASYSSLFGEADDENVELDKKEKQDNLNEEIEMKFLQL